MSERVYYMDRGRNTLVTDSQLVIAGRRYSLDRIRGARVEGKHKGDDLFMERALQIAGALGVVGAFIAVVLLGHTPQGNSLFWLSSATSSSSLIILVLLSISEKQGHALVLHHSSGVSEEVAWDGDREQSFELAQAVQEALSTRRPTS
jgi:hypothetical protein